MTNAQGKSGELAMVIEAARDLVSLWENQKIKALPRSERNAAIDDTRTRLANAVHALGSPYPADDIEAVTRAIVDCHPRCEHHRDYAGWIEVEKLEGDDGDFAREWLAARRLEAKSALAIARSPAPQELPGEEEIAWSIDAIPGMPDDFSFAHCRMIAKTILSLLPHPPEVSGLREALEAWAVIDSNGNILVRTISDTRRAAIVNWLCTERGLLATQLATDEHIERMWDANRGAGAARVTQVVIALPPTPQLLPVQEGG